MAVVKTSKKNTGLIVTIVAVIVVVLTVALISGYKEKKEFFPTFQDVAGKVETQVGNYYLEKQVFLGDPTAPVKVIEFIDYKCPYCAAWSNDNFPKFKKDYIDTGKVQLFVVNFSFLGPDSIKAAMVGEILWKQSPQAFWEYHEAIYKHQGDEKTIWATEKHLLSIIERYVPHGDAKDVKRSLEQLEGLMEVKEDFKITTTNGVSSVPTFIVDGEDYENPELSELSSAIDSRLELLSK